MKNQKNHTAIFNGICTGQCGEEPLIPYGSCNLIGINWSKFIKNGKFDYEEFEKVIRLAVRVADRAIDLNEYPLKEIEETSKYIRQIGIYPLGVHDALIKLNLGYDTEEGIEFVEKVLEFIDVTAWSESKILGDKYGEAPVISDSLTNMSLVPFGARNTAMTTCAPGGTTSIIGNCSNGIEPIYSYVMNRVGDLS